MCPTIPLRTSAIRGSVDLGEDNRGMTLTTGARDLGASVCIAAPCRRRATEAALCAAVIVGVGVAVGEPRMA
jgi:hypothetical protein